MKFEIDFNNSIDTSEKIYKIYKLKDYSSCEVIAEKFLSLHPSDVTVKCLLALSKLHQGKLEDNLPDILKDIPENISLEIITELITFFITKKDSAKAQQLNENVLTVFEPLIATLYQNKAKIAYLEGNTKVAIEYYIKSVSLRTELPALLMLVELLRQEGNYTEALSWINQGVALYPDNFQLLFKKACLLKNICDWQCEAIFNDLIKSAPQVITPFWGVISIPDSAVNYKLALLYAKLKQTNLPSSFSPYHHQPKTREKLKIGYISMGFNNHPTGRMLLNAFNYHDKNKYEIYVYSLITPKNDDIALTIKASCDVYRIVDGLSPSNIAEKIYQDNIDILVDFDGYLARNKIEIFAYRPAPIQITYLGFPGTTGTDFFDYIVADKTIIPESDVKFFSEKIIYMSCYQINNGPQTEAKKVFHKEDIGVSNDTFVFSCLNMPHKIDSKSFTSWMRVLTAVPNSVLWLLSRHELIEKNLRHAASKAGIDPARLIFSSLASKEEHLARLKISDVFLDTFICNAHSSATDALRSNVPIVTLQGTHFASRVCSSLLKYVGLEPLITHSIIEYEEMAIKLANDPELLKKYKAILQENLPKTLFNTEKTIKNLEQAYTEIWKRYIEHKPPASIEIL